MMAKVGKPARFLAGVGGAILILTATYHGMGYSGIKHFLEQSSVENEWALVLAGLWVFVSWHWVVIAAPPVWLAIRPHRQLWPAVAFCGVVAFADFIWVLLLAGFFAGTGLLLLASLCMIASAVVVDRG